MPYKASTLALLVLLSRVRTPSSDIEFPKITRSGVEPDGDTHDVGIVANESEAATMAANVESEASH